LAALTGRHGHLVFGEFANVGGQARRLRCGRFVLHSMNIQPLQGPHGLYTVSAMPHFLLDSALVGWRGAYFTDIICAPEGIVDHGHTRYCVQRGMHTEKRRVSGSSFWRDFGEGFSVWRAGDEQQLNWRGAGRSQFLFVAPVLADSVLEGTRPLKTLGHHQPEQSRVLEHIFDALQSDLALGSPAGPLVGDSLIAALLAHLTGQDVRTKSGSRSRACDRAIDLIEARFSEQVRLHELADAVGLGVRQFSREFRRATGQTPHQYLLRRRVEHAKQLISSAVPLAEVAVQCGFADQSQLTRTFAHQVGTPPGRYRRRMPR
jgi:AraC family transcriptional regulator